LDITKPLICRKTRTESHWAPSLLKVDECPLRGHTLQTREVEYEAYVVRSHGSRGGQKKDKKDEKKGGHVLVYGEEKKDKKDEKKGGHMDTFGDEKKKDEKKGGK
jgi:hypothetical protein